MTLKITRLGSAPKVPFRLDGKIMLSNQRLEIVHLTLRAGEVLLKHVNDFDVAIFVLEGKGIVETGSMSAEAIPGILFEIDGGIERGITNTGEVDFKVL
ncbi:MAG: hypothetical protein Q8M23_02090, partial [Bacteroidales bacterium]|nr:hypothetical protein [Bacteroidales bacterium]